MIPPIDDSLLVAFADRQLDPATSYLVEEFIRDNAEALAKVRLFERSAMLIASAFRDAVYLEVPSIRIPSRRGVSLSRRILSFLARLIRDR
jgi:anti-sigma factor RsiW